VRILVCGGRDYGYKWKDNKKVRDLAIFNKAIDVVKVLNPTLVIHGGATGADEIAPEVARVLDIPVMRFPADWNTYHKAAGPIRNQQMLDEGKPDLVVAFPGGTGTADMVRRAKKAGVKVLEIEV
jgi:predicted Rossmann-fold nucleotide-binding protein